MDDLICRLCCSTNFVNNDIFDEENALYLKMSLYLPIKVLKNDSLPQKICDKCSCKVNDFYQFCNETIEVQNRLHSLLLPRVSQDVVDLTRIKHNTSPAPHITHAQTPSQGTHIHTLSQGTHTQSRSQGTQTDIPSTSCNDAPVIVKQEPRTSPLKEEAPYQYYDGFSDNSDDMSLITLKKKKKSKKHVSNGAEKRGRKKKAKLQELEMLINALPETSTLSGQEELQVKLEPETEPALLALDVSRLKHEPLEPSPMHCCVCMMQCYSKTEMIQHYKEHGQQQSCVPPPAPAPPDTEPARCPRCKKMLSLSEWSSHWSRHWERDTRPYRCSLCEKAFRDPAQIFKHGLTHQKGGAEQEEPRDKRFVCDLCPEGFVYMRYLMAHRLRAHPEAAARALTLRCGVCARSFAHLNSLRRHLRAHSGERNHLCNVCGKALSSREHLKFHIRIHTGHKPNVCATCGKGFVKKCNLTLHERVHSGEKPHVCAHCGKAFSQRSTLVIHERYHSGARPYVCALCGRGFVAKGLLSVHLKTTCI